MPTPAWYQQNSKIASEMGDAASVQAAKGAAEAVNQPRQSKLEALLKGQSAVQEAGLKKQAADEERQRSLGAMKDMQDIAPEGAGVKYGEGAITPDPFARQLAMQGRMQQAQTREESAEGEKVNAAANKTYSPFEGQFSALERMHTLVGQKSNVADKQLGANLARLTEGPGQRLLESVVNSLSGGKTLPGNINDKANWLTGKANSGFTDTEHTAINDNLNMHQQLLQNDYNDADGQFKQIAPSLAPSLATQGKLDGYVNAHSSRVQGSLMRLNKMQQANAPQTPQAAPDGAPAPQTPPPAQNAGLPGLIKGNANATPPSASGAIRVREKKSGQTGMWSPSATEPTLDPNQYDKL